MTCVPARARARALALLLSGLGLAAPAAAAPVRLHLANGINAVVHRPEDLMASHIVRSGEAAQLIVNERLRYALITDVDDPAIANRGDGRFYPMSVDAVVAASRQSRA